MEIKIDSEFKTLIAPLTHEEYKLLEASIMSPEGCRDALVIWKQEGILLDGHHRYDICSRHGIPYRTEEYEFEDRTEVKKWIYDNQLGRRNLTDEYRTYIIGARYELEKTNGHGSKSVYNNCTQNTRERLAGNNNVSEQTVVNAAKYKQAIDTIADHSYELKDSILRGELKIWKRDVMQFGAVHRKNKALAEKALDELIAGNTSGFKHSIYNIGDKNMSGNKSNPYQTNGGERMYTEAEMKAAFSTAFMAGMRHALTSQSSLDMGRCDTTIDIFWKRYLIDNIIGKE